MREINPEKTLEETVKKLQAAKAKGEKVYCKFKGVKLDSMSINMINAYLYVYKMTKEDFDKYTAASLPWIEKSKDLLLPEKIEEFEDTLLFHFKNDQKAYYNIELALDIMKVLSTEDGLNIAKEVYKKISSKQISKYYDLEIIKDLVLNFSKKGPSFYLAVESENLSESIKQDLIEMQKKIDEKNIIKETEEYSVNRKPSL